MTVDDCRVWLDKMKDHKECCGTTQVRFLIGECEKIEKDYVTTMTRLYEELAGEDI